MMRIFFYANTNNRKQFSLKGFLRTDINILRKSGNKVFLCQHYYHYFLFWKYDVAFIYFYRYGLLPAIIAKFFGKKVIFTGGIDFLDPISSSAKDYYIQKVFFKLCNIFSDYNIIVSEADWANIKKIHPEIDQRKKFIKSPHVIEVDSYRCSGFNEKELIFTTVAWMGRFENVDRKGVDLSILVFNELIHMDKFKAARFYIIGTIGEGGKRVQQLAKDLGLEDKITFTDSISEEKKIELLKKSRYYFQLSKYEGFGIAALEALCSGNIVIHSAKGGLNEAIGKRGLIVNIKLSPKEIADSIDKNADLFINSRLNSMDYVISNYSFYNRFRDISSVLNNL